MRDTFKACASAASAQTPFRFFDILQKSLPVPIRWVISGNAWSAKSPSISIHPAPLNRLARNEPPDGILALPILLAMATSPCLSSVPITVEMELALSRPFLGKRSRIARTDAAPWVHRRLQNRHFELTEPAQDFVFCKIVPAVTSSPWTPIANWM